MPRSEPSNRSTSLAAAATTLMALLAVAATAQTSPMCVAGTMTTEAMLASESKAVRAVAKVVVAVAREILAAGQTTAALPAQPAPDLLPWHSAVRVAVVAHDDVRVHPRLAERLLDLPPPAV